MVDWNRQIFELVYGLSHQSAILDALGVFLAEYLPYILVVGFLMLAMASRTSRRRIAKIAEGALSVILARAIFTEALHFFYRSPRPFEVLSVPPLVSEISNSFPSGHAAFFFALAVTLFLWDRLWGSVFLGAAAAVSLGRIYVGVHWPSDILGGIVAGVASALIVRLMLSEYLKALRPAEEHPIPTGESEEGD